MKNIIFGCAILGFVLVGCGGGDNSGGGQNPPPEQGGPQVLPPVQSVPSPLYSDVRRAQAFLRANYYRKALGLGLLSQSNQLDAAAQAHAQYIVENGLSHSEVPGKVGYTGISPSERAGAAGYQSLLIGEDAGVHSGDGAVAVDEFMNTLYHRIPFIRYGYVDLGVGIAPSKDQLSGFYVSVLNFGIPANSLGQGGAVPYVVWPLGNSIVESLEIKRETPSPPGIGYPVTVSFDPRKTIATNRFELRESGSSIVQTYLLTSTTDPNKLLPPSIVALMPREGLKPSTGFTAVWEGTVDGLPLTVNWAFTTK